MKQTFPVKGHYMTRNTEYYILLIRLEIVVVEFVIYLLTMSRCKYLCN